jgi:hypothetical protein
MIEIEPMGTYRCKIKLRPLHNGQPLKPAALAIDGEEMVLTYGWRVEPDEQYAGETALLFTDFPPPKGLGWIASGDVEVLEELPCA